MERRRDRLSRKGSFVQRSSSSYVAGDGSLVKEMDAVGQTRNRLALSIWCLLLLIPPAHGADARGSMRLASCSLFDRYRLTLVGFQTQGSETALEFSVPDESVLEREKDWIAVDATVECARATRCELFGQGKIQILRMFHGRRGSLKSIFGKFVVTFSDGRKIEGDFSAKFTTPSAPQICE